ncbi:MAG: Rrf2 family transcriptional regulator [Brevinematales bacterium]|nr:Rrf2 family transcriptional regulator [Brevinematales bacterium]
MKMPTKLRYGLRFMSNIAVYYGRNELVSISHIAEEEQISNKYLEQIISSFVKAGFIKGNRGKGGGYKLIKDPKKINIYEIASALNEDMTFVPCVRGVKNCYRKAKKRCAVGDFWHEMSDQVVDLMKNRSLNDLLVKN